MPISDSFVLTHKCIMTTSVFSNSNKYQMPYFVDPAVM